MFHIPKDIHKQDVSIRAFYSKESRRDLIITYIFCCIIAGIAIYIGYWAGKGINYLEAYVSNNYFNKPEPPAPEPTDEGAIE